MKVEDEKGRSLRGAMGDCVAPARLKDVDKGLEIFLNLFWLDRLFSHG